jgi:hypothetical protein
MKLHIFFSKRSNICILVNLQLSATGIWNEMEIQFYLYANFIVTILPIYFILGQSYRQQYNNKTLL